MPTLNAAAWSLHDSLYELARSRGLRSFRVECRATERGETHVTLILDPAEEDGRGPGPAKTQGRR